MKLPLKKHSGVRITNKHPWLSRKGKVFTPLRFHVIVSCETFSYLSVRVAHKNTPSRTEHEVVLIQACGLFANYCP